MAKPLIQLIVESNPALPDGATLRYKAESEIREARRVVYEPDDGPEGEWQVYGIDAQGRRTPAHAVQVEDSGAGTSWLVWGDAWGLRLRRGEQEVAETHVLLAPDQLLD